MTQDKLLSIPSGVTYKPHEYQKRAIRFLLEHAVGGLFLDCGLGKTSIVLAALKVLKDKGIMKRTLIIAPLRVCWSVWPEEVKKWSDFNGLRVEVLHGPKKAEALERDADIYCINPDGLEWLMLQCRAEKLGCDVLVVDESTAFKNSKALRSKLLKYLIPTFRRRYILTGTPAPNGLLDLFGQIYILDQGNALGRYITHYRMNYFNPTGFGGYKWVPKEGAADTIYEKLRPMTLRMSAEDYLELPERVDNVITVDLPEKARKVYRELEIQFITTLNSGETITAPSAAAVGVKLRQVANGGVYRSPEKRAEARTHVEEWAHLHDAKLDALEELVEGRQGKPVLVAYEFEQDADRIRKRFPQAVFLSDSTGTHIEETIAAWNRGDIEMLCAHPASAGHGLNLQQDKDTVIWFGLTWNLEHFQQFNARVLRQGNKSPRVFFHYIVARNTTDAAVMSALRSKDKTQNALLMALKDYAKENQ